MTERREQPLCPVQEEVRVAELLCCLARTYLGRAKHSGQIFSGWCFEQLVLVVCGQFPSWGMLCCAGLCWLVRTKLGGGVWVM